MHNFPREFVGDKRITTPKKLLEERCPEKILTLADGLSVGKIHAAFDGARYLASWWKVHNSAHVMAKLAMASYGYTWNTQTDIALMCVALSLMVQKAKEADDV